MRERERAFSVIEHLARRGPSSLRDVARELDLPVSSVHRLLHSLERERVVERTGGDELGVGHRVLELAGAQLERLGLPAVARPSLEQLSARTGSSLRSPGNSQLKVKHVQGCLTT